MSGNRRAVVETPQLRISTEDDAQGVALIVKDECNSTCHSVRIPWEAVPAVLSDLAVRNRIRPEERKS